LNGISGSKNRAIITDGNPVSRQIPDADPPAPPYRSEENRFPEVGMRVRWIENYIFLEALHRV
jgi:hypothetical protein